MQVNIPGNHGWYEKSSPQNFLRKFGARHKMFDDKPGENYVCYPEIAMDVSRGISNMAVCWYQVPGEYDFY